MKVVLAVVCMLIVVLVALRYRTGGERVGGTASVGASKYRPGQVWEYRTRQGEEASMLYIFRVDAGGKMGKVYSIYLDNIALKNPHVESGVQDNLPHAPVMQESLDKSVTKLVSDGAKEPEGFAEAYKEWHVEFAKGEAGAFAIPAAQIVQCMEDAVRRADSSSTVVHE